MKIWKRGPVVIDRVFSPHTEGDPLPPGDPCPNCGDRTPGHYCRHCGQARRVVHVSLREMIADFLDDQLTLNSRLPRSVAVLLLRPGFLTREYLRGRIASYIRPLKLYVGTSVVFFLLFALAARAGGWAAPELSLGGDQTSVRAAQAARVRAHADSLARALKARDGRLPAAIPAPPPVPVRVGTEVIVFRGMGAFGDTLNAKAARYATMSRAEKQRVIAGALQDELPRMMFVMLPIFALLLKMLYLRQRRFYVEHFVFSLHFHAFVFLMLTLVLGAEQLPELRRTPVEGIAVGWIFLYLYLAMKRVYGQGIFRTGTKYGMLLFSYLFVLVLGFLATLLAFVYFL